MSKTPTRRTAKVQEPAETLDIHPNIFEKPRHKAKAVTPIHDVKFAPGLQQNENNVLRTSKLGRTPNAKKRKREDETTPAAPGAAPVPRDPVDNPPVKRRALAEVKNDVVLPAPTLPSPAQVEVKLEPKPDPAFTFNQDRGVQLIPRAIKEEIKNELVHVTDGPGIMTIPLFSQQAALEETKPSFIGALFLGNVDVATNHSWQDDVEIKAVVNAAKELNDMKYDPKISFKLHLVDEDKTQLEGPEVEKALEFIEMQRQAGNSVLVHCFMGQSRSVSLIVLYMIKKCFIPLKDCMDMLEKNGVKNTMKHGMMTSLMKADMETHGRMTYDFFDTRGRKCKTAALQNSPWIEKENGSENRLSRTAPSTPKRPSTPNRKALGPKRTGAAAKSPASVSKSKAPKKAAATKSTTKIPPTESQKSGSFGARQIRLDELFGKLKKQAEHHSSASQTVGSETVIQLNSEEDDTLGSLII